MDKMLKHKDLVHTAGLVVHDEYTAQLYEEMNEILSPDIYVSSPQLCSDGADFSVPKEIADSLNYHTKEKYKFILNGEEKVSRYEFLKDYYGSKRGSFCGYTCWPVVKILPNGNVRHCVHDEGNPDNEILFNETRICDYNTCSLCNISRVERTVDET